MSLSISDRKAKIKYLKNEIEGLNKQLQEARDLNDCSETFYKVGEIVNPSKNVNNIVCYTFNDRDLIIDDITLCDYDGAIYECTVLNKDGSRSKYNTTKFYIESLVDMLTAE